MSAHITEEDLCRMEMKYIFNQPIEEKYLFSEIKIHPSRSSFIKHSIFILHYADSLDELITKLTENKVTYNKFKFVQVKVEGSELEYTEWIKSASALGVAINGEIDMKHPLITLAVIKIKGKWLFGEYEKNDNDWLYHDKKPNTNTHSIGLKTARALVNIAIGSDAGCKLVDPCCGVGTVVIEAASMGIDVKGFDINWSIAEKAKSNLAFFGYENIISNADMHQIQEYFDVAIVDIPYGLFTPITQQQQIDIISTARRIANKCVIITFENMDEIIVSNGFKIIDSCKVWKSINGKFKRYISVCN